MEKQKPGRKPLPLEQKRALVAAFLTKAEKELIINKYGSLSHAVRVEILEKTQNGYSNSTGDGQPLAGQ